MEQKKSKKNPKKSPKNNTAHVCKPFQDTTASQLSKVKKKERSLSSAVTEAQNFTYSHISKGSSPTLLSEILGFFTFYKTQKITKPEQSQNTTTFPLHFKAKNLSNKRE